VEPIVILVGTMSGNAEMVADELVSKLKKTGFAAQSIDMSKCGPGTFRPENLYIICTSTYGDGDVPDNATEFYGYLTTQRPDLTGIRYGVVGLGDRLYDATFCNGGKRFDTILTELGAMRLAERVDNDASSGRYPDEVALEWLPTWLEAICHPELVEGQP
jgi:MioC protein